MAEVKDKLVDLEDLKVLSDDTTAKLGGKLAVPLNEGTEGQVLTAKGDGTSEWADAQGGSLDINKDGVLLKNGVPVSTLYVTDNVASIVAFAVDEFNSALTLKSNPDISRYQSIIWMGTNVSSDGLSTLSATEYVGPIKSFSIVLSSKHVRNAIFEEDFYVSDERSYKNKAAYLTPSKDRNIPGPCKGDETTISMEVGTGILSVNHGGITMSHLAQDVKDAISAGGGGGGEGGGSTVSDATIRRIVNEQLAKMKFTVNDQGHLIIETPEA